MSKETGGQAFPTPENWQLGGVMTLRDYFAAAALQGAVANGCDRSWPASIDPTIDNDDTDAKCLVRCCYILADAMLTERSK